MRYIARSLVFSGPVPVPVPSRSALIQAARGGLAEAAVYASLHPLDGLVMRATLRAPASAAGGAVAARVRLFCLPALIRSAGGAAAGTALFALAYAMLLESCGGTDERTSPARAAAAAAVASVVSIAADAPLRAAAAGKRVAATTGWRHAVAAAARDVPADAAEFGAYNLFRGASSSPAARCGAGAIAGALSTLMVAPLDVALVRMIASPGCRRIGFAAAVRQVLADPNRAAKFAGVGQRCLREALASAMFFCAYEAGAEGDEKQF